MPDELQGSWAGWQACGRHTPANVLAGAGSAGGGGGGGEEGAGMRPWNVVGVVDGCGARGAWVTMRRRRVDAMVSTRDKVQSATCNVQQRAGGGGGDLLVGWRATNDVTAYMTRRQRQRAEGTRWRSDKANRSRGR
jgi:hypothetical protein